VLGGSWWAPFVALLQQGGGSEGLPPAATGYGVQLVRSLAALAGVCVAAWWVLRWAAKRGLGQMPKGRALRVLERVPLDARRSLYLVQVGQKRLLLGASEQSLSLLAELRPEDLASEGAASAAGQGVSAVPAASRASGTSAQEAAGARFAQVLARIRGQSSAGAREAASEEGERASAGGTGEQASEVGTDGRASEVGAGAGAGGAQGQGGGNAAGTG
jgi:flagellar biosynthetic protein FliO